MGGAREQAVAHLDLVAPLPGFWELRALQRIDGTTMSARGSFFIIAAWAGDGFIYDRLESAIDWTGG